MLSDGDKLYQIGTEQSSFNKIFVMVYKVDFSAWPCTCCTDEGGVHLGYGTQRGTACTLALTWYSTVFCFFLRCWEAPPMSGPCSKIPHYHPTLAAHVGTAAGNYICPWMSAATQKHHLELLISTHNLLQIREWDSNRFLTNIFWDGKLEQFSIWCDQGKQIPHKVFRPVIIE